MSTQMTPAQMVAQFKLWKCDLNLYSGYATRGYGPGSISDVEGIIVHHTGSDAQSDSYLNFLFVEGRPDVPPPLCNWATDMDGDLWLGAVERANHAGMGSSATLNKVVAGNYDWRNTTIRPGVDNINGNSRYYGNEVRFDGGQPMTTAQWKTVVLSCAAVCDFHNWGAWHVIGHKEHTSRKPDPGSTLMYMLRRDVDAALKAGPGNWPTQGDDMSQADVDQIKAFLRGMVDADSNGTLGVWQEQNKAQLANFYKVEADRYVRYEAIHQAQTSQAEANTAEIVAAVKNSQAAVVAAVNSGNTSIVSALTSQTAVLTRLTEAVEALTVPPVVAPKA